MNRLLLIFFLIHLSWTTCAGILNGRRRLEMPPLAVIAVCHPGCLTSLSLESLSMFQNAPPLLYTLLLHPDQASGVAPLPLWIRRLFQNAPPLRRVGRARLTGVLIRKPSVEQMKAPRRATARILQHLPTPQKDQMASVPPSSLAWPHLASHRPLGSHQPLRPTTSQSQPFPSSL